jgi:dihydrofolate reductase
MNESAAGSFSPRVAHPSFFEGWDSRVPVAGDFAFHFLISQTHRLAFGGIALRAGQDNQMRNVIFAINITLDGCCDHTKQVADDESHEYFTHLLREVDLLVFGRKTYQLMVPFWPDVAKNQSMSKAENEFARTFDSIEKIVFSRSLDGAEDNNTRIVRTTLRDEILRLKQEPGKHILVGGVDIPSQLIELGLVDEYRFVVGPIVAGEGRRLLEGVSLRERQQLKLIESKTFKSGCVALRYLKQ